MKRVLGYKVLVAASIHGGLGCKPACGADVRSDKQACQLLNPALISDQKWNRHGMTLEQLMDTLMFGSWCSSELLSMEEFCVNSNRRYLTDSTAVL